MSQEPSLKRVIGFWGITFYGLGGIIGAGIFATIGAIGGRAGLWAPFAFMIASIPALFAALSYGELVRRLPKAGGEASYVQEAFGRMWLTRLTAGGVALSGMVSAATLTVAFAGYVIAAVDMPAWIIMSILVIASAGLAAVGVSLASGVVITITVIEVCLLIVIAVTGSGDILSFAGDISRAEPPDGLFAILASASVLAFFAFIGFEDVVNMAEEVKDAPRIVPRALLVAFAVSLLLYILVTIAAIQTVPAATLADSTDPLGEVVRRQGVLPDTLMLIMALASIGNGVIIQVNMVSRLVYGLVQYGGAPKILGQVSAATQTPVVGIAASSALILLFAFMLPLEQLATITGMILLMVFALVQLALMKLLTAEGLHPTRNWRAFIIPALGVTSAILLMFGAFV